MSPLIMSQTVPHPGHGSCAQQPVGSRYSPWAPSLRSIAYKPFDRTTSLSSPLPTHTVGHGQPCCSAVVSQGMLGGWYQDSEDAHPRPHLHTVWILVIWALKQLPQSKSSSPAFPDPFTHHPSPELLFQLTQKSVFSTVRTRS